MLGRHVGGTAALVHVPPASGGGLPTEGCMLIPVFIYNYLTNGVWA